MRRATVLFTVTLFLATALAGCLGTFSSDGPPTVSMTVLPTSDIMEGHTVSFNAAGSSDPDGDDLSFAWDFGDGNVATGQTASHVYNSPGTFEVELCVSSTDFLICDVQVVTVAPAGALNPTASIIYYKDNDCTGENPAAGTHILAWICEEEMETSDDIVDTKTTIQLDGSDSSAGDSSSYLIDFEWDLDIYVDSDGDGIMDNDVDLSGEEVEWTNVWPGEYEILLTVTNNHGLTDTMDMDVYVNYRGAWAEFTIDSNGTSGTGTATFEYPLVYHQDHSSQTHSIRYVKIQATYPKLDDDWPAGTCSEQTGCSNRLDIYAYNGSQSDSDTEEIANTTYLADEDQTAGDCSDDDRCVELRLSTQHFRNYDDGEWTMHWTVDLVNEKAHDTTVKSFVIILEYK